MINSLLSENLDGNLNDAVSLDEIVLFRFSRKILLKRKLCALILTSEMPRGTSSFICNGKINFKIIVTLLLIKSGLINYQFIFVIQARVKQILGVARVWYENKCLSSLVLWLNFNFDFRKLKTTYKCHRTSFRLFESKACKGKPVTYNSSFVLEKLMQNLRFVKIFMSNSKMLTFQVICQIFIP